MIDRFFRYPSPPGGEIFMRLGPIDGILGPAVGVEAARERGQIPLLAGRWDTRTKVQATYQDDMNLIHGGNAARILRLDVPYTRLFKPPSERVGRRGSDRDGHRHPTHAERPA
jgi:hypothetical protein